MTTPRGPWPALGGETSLTRSALHLTVAKTLAFLFSFVLPLLLVRRLSQADFGLYKQIFLAVSTAVTVLPLGFAMSAFYFFPRHPQRKPAAVFNILVFHFCLGALAWAALIIFPDGLALIFNSPELTMHASLIGFVILLWAMTTPVEIVMIANEESRLAATFIAGANLAKTALLLIAVLWFGSIRALVSAAVVQGVLQVAVLAWYMRTRFPAWWMQRDWSLMRSQLSYAVPLGVAALLYFLQMDLHQYFVSNRFGAATYAIYAIGSLQLPLVGLLNESVGSVMIPRVSRLQTGHHREEIVQLIARMMRKLAVLYFPLYGVLLVIGPEFIRLLFTEQYLASWPIFAINLTLLPLSILGTACDSVIRAYHEHRFFYMRVRAVLSVVAVVGLWIMTARFQLLGAISVVAATITIERLVTAVKVGRILELSERHAPLFRDLGKLAAATGTATLLAGVTRHLWQDRGPGPVLGACVVIFALAYLGMIRVLGVLSPEERRAVRQYRLLRPLFPGAELR